MRSRIGRALQVSARYGIGENELLEGAMVKFYDPKDQADQARVESLLQAAAIEYFLAPESGNGACREIEVAEEDVPKAEEVLLKAGR